MKRYDPLTAPDAAEWLAIDEGERIELVDDYHRRARDRMPGTRAQMHAAIHVTIENQIALGDETPVKAVAARLMAEGLDRHEAVHAIGSVLAGVINDLARAGAGAAMDVEGLYYAELKQLTAKSWRESG